MRREYAILVLVAFVWGSGHPIGKLILREVHPIQLSMLSAVLTFLALTLIMTATKDLGRIRKLDRRGFLLSLTAGGLIFFTYPILSFSALQRIPASVNSILVATSTIFVALIALAALGEQLSPINYLGIGGAFLGVYFVIVSSGGGFSNLGSLSMMGVSLSLTGAVVTAFYTVIGKKAMSRYDAITITLIASLAGSLLQVAATALWVGFTELATTSTFAMALIAYWGVFSGIGYFLFYRCMKTLEASRAAVFVYLSPLFAVTLSFLILRERIGPLLLLGVALILGGVRFTQTRKPKPKIDFPEKS